MFQIATQLDVYLVFKDDILQISAGLISEQLVEQELLSYKPSLLFYLTSSLERLVKDVESSLA